MKAYLIIREHPYYMMLFKNLYVASSLGQAYDKVAALRMADHASEKPVASGYRIEEVEVIE